MATREMIPTPHRVPPELLTRAVKLLVVGCGGTGAAFASGLPYLHQSMIALGHPGGLSATLADGDRITESNCVRQPFSAHEVGRPKAEVLATRINHAWGLAWSAVTRNVAPEDYLTGFDIVVGCVDTRAARRLLAASTRRDRVRYWLDAGNGPDFGQVILGEPGGSPDHPRLPTVDELLPDAVRPGREAGPSCSAVEALTRQAPFTNHLMAYHMLFLLGTLFRTGALQHHGLFINPGDGTVAPLAVDPRAWAALRGIPAGHSA